MDQIKRSKKSVGNLLINHIRKWCISKGGLCHFTSLSVDRTLRTDYFQLMKSFVHCSLVSSGDVTVCPIVLSEVKIS